MVLLLALTACVKPRCQDPVEEAFTTFTEQEWRLVDTTDLAISPNLSNFTFETITFELNFEGVRQPWVNNQEVEDQDQPFT